MQDLQKKTFHTIALHGNCMTISFKKKMYKISCYQIFCSSLTLTAFSALNVFEINAYQTISKHENCMTGILSIHLMSGIV